MIESLQANTDAKQLLSGSCPDLTEEQLEMWDNYLVSTWSIKYRCQALRFDQG